MWRAYEIGYLKYEIAYEVGYLLKLYCHKACIFPTKCVF